MSTTGNGGDSVSTREDCRQGMRPRLAGAVTGMAAAVVLSACCLSLFLALSDFDGTTLRQGSRGSLSALVVVGPGSIAPLLLTILLADIGVFSLVLASFLGCRHLGERRTAAAVTTWLCLVVLSVLFSLLTGKLPPGAAFRRDLAAKFAALLPLVFFKEHLFRRLHRAYAIGGLLSYQALAWHCRKDALFNAFFLLAATAGLVGLQAERVHYLLYFAKLHLLGGACLALAGRLLETPPAGGIARDRGAPSGREFSCGLGGHGGELMKKAESSSDGGHGRELAEKAESSGDGGHGRR